MIQRDVLEPVGFRGGIGFLANLCTLRRTAQPGEVVGHMLYGHCESMSRITLEGTDLHDTIDVVRHFDINLNFCIGR